MPVREALIQLAAEGLVTVIPRRGVYVAALEPEDVLDHYRIYGLICGVAAERAAKKLPASQLEDLAALLRRMDAETDRRELEAMNIEFHRAINRAGGSGRLLAVLRMLASSLPTTFFEFADGWAEQAQKHHWQILDALKRSDSEAAAAAVRDHLSIGANFAVEDLRSRGFWKADDETLASEATS